MARFEELDPEFRQAVFERLQKRVPYWNLQGMELMDLKKGWARPRLPFSEKLGNAGEGAQLTGVRFFPLRMPLWKPP